MSSAHYQLTGQRDAWRHALLSVASLLPSDVQLDNFQALQLLPVFAVVVVVDNETLDSYANVTHHHPDELMLAWAREQSSWALSIVQDNNDDGVPIMMSVDREVHPAADVSVFRYLLMPTDKSTMVAGKRESIAHIIDDQLTAYLRKKLKPKPMTDYKVNDVGEVVDFQLGVGTKHHYVDCHILSVSQVLRQHKLACFDMDSTLIKQEVIVELAKMAGVGEQVDKITERAMRGEIDFTRSFVERVGLLAGTDAKIINEIKPLLIPSNGAFTAIAALRALGYRTVLISGGFVPFAKYVAELLGIDEYYANELEVENGQLTGNVVMPIIDGNQKAKIMAKIADRMSISLDEVIAVGDGANDLPMMALADIGVAYHAKPIVQAKADAAVNVTGLEGVLYALGYAGLEVL